MPCKKKAKKKKTRQDEDTKTRRKYKKGGRIEAYTYGEALKSKRWP